MKKFLELASRERELMRDIWGSLRSGVWLVEGTPRDSRRFEGLIKGSKGRR